jgi:uncharacterized protein (DUF58 family)
MKLSPAKLFDDWWLPRLCRKFHAFWTQGARQQVTGAGVAYTVALAAVGSGAFISTNNLLFLIFAAMLATLLISGFLGRLGIAGLEISAMVPEHISARRNVRATIRLRNLKRFVPSFSIHLSGSKESGLTSVLYFPAIPGGVTLEEPVELYFPKRGAQRDRTFQFSTRFPFGFAERREMVTAQHDILVYPCVDAQAGFDELLTGVRGEMEAQQRGRGPDFYRIRPYEALESARHVDWKATAHTGSLQVREFAREQDNRAIIYFDLDAEPGAWFESAVDCAAFLAFQLTARGTEVRLRTQEFDVSVPDEGDVYTILKYLALVSPMRGKPPAAPDDLTCYQLILTSNPRRMASLGWGAGQERGARVLGPGAFSEPVE